MRNTPVSIVLTCLLGLFFFKVGSIMIDAYTASCVENAKNDTIKKEDFNRVAKDYLQMTPAQRDSVLHVWKLSKGLK